MEVVNNFPLTIVEKETSSATSTSEERPREFATTGGIRRTRRNFRHEDAELNQQG